MLTSHVSLRTIMAPEMARLSRLTKALSIFESLDPFSGHWVRSYVHVCLLADVLKT